MSPVCHWLLPWSPRPDHPPSTPQRSPPSRIPWFNRPRRTAQDTTLLEGNPGWAETSLAQGIRGCISPQIPLCLLNQRHKVPQQPSDSWGLLRVPGGLNYQHSQSRRDLLQGEQGLLQQFRGDAVSGQHGHWSIATTHRLPMVVHHPLPDNGTMLRL